MTKEERAKIARENGAKSQGPKTEEGKEKSARNGIKTGEFAKKLAAFVPPDSAVLCNEQRQVYFNLMDQLMQIYSPINQESANLVRQIAIARWQIERLHTSITNVWNFALLKAAGEPSSVVEEMEEAETAARAAQSLFSGSSPVERMSRQIDRLEIRITRLRRGIKDIHDNFPTVAKPMKTNRLTKNRSLKPKKANPISTSPNAIRQSSPPTAASSPTTKSSSCPPTTSPKASRTKTICHRRRER